MIPALLLAPIFLAAQSDPPRPNIVYVMADDLGWGDLGSYGQEHVATPRLDQMAAEGMRFTAHYSGSTVCAPSRASLMTGLHTGHTHVRGNKEAQPLGQYPLPAEAVTVAELLRDAGYATAMMGKWGLGPPDSTGEPTRQGFDHWFGYSCQRRAHRFYPDFLWRSGTRVPIDQNADGARGAYSHDLIVEEALWWLRNRPHDRPFFLYLPLTIPHADLDVPEDSVAPYAGRFEETPHRRGGYLHQERPKEVFAGMVSRLDRDVGRVLDTIDALGLRENTLVIFTSDNGPHQEGGAQPKFFRSSGPFRGIKRDLYEGGIRVPMLARWPGRVAAGSESGHVSAFWDFLPTACELAGAPAPSGLDGISYVGALTDSEQATHEYLYWEFHERGGRQAVRAGNWKAVRLDVKKPGETRFELYDLEADPGETRDVAAENPEVASRLAVLLARARTPHSFWRFPGDPERE